MLKNAIWLFITATVVLLVFLPSFTKMQDIKQRNGEYQKEIQALKADNTKLTEERRLLEEDPVYLEKVAREKMGLARDGEVVYRLTPANKEQ